MAESVEVCPSQIDGGLAIALIVGVETTDNVAVVELKQPNAFVPDTEYIVVVFGLAFTLEPLAEFKVEAGDQVYVFAPLADKAAKLPLQIMDGVVTIDIMGFAVIVTITSAEFVQVLVAPITV